MVNNEQGNQGIAGNEAQVTSPAEASVESSAENSQNPAASSSAPPNQANNTAWIGGVKKEARQKGYDEGYQHAMNEIREKFQMTANDNPSSSEQSNVAPQQAVPSQPVQQQPSATPTPEQIAAQAAQITQQNHYSQVGAKAMAKYGTDYVNKMNEYNQVAAEMISQYQNDDMARAMLLAAEVGNEDLVYKLASDESFRNDVLNSNPRMWTQKLINHHVNSQPTAQQLAATKVNGEPTENMPQSASYGEMSQPSWAERRRKVRNTY